MGTGNQDEDQDPVFRVDNGATLKNVIIGDVGADGIHLYNSATLEYITFQNVGEDAVTVKSEGSYTLRNIEGYDAEDKFFQINAACTFDVGNCVIHRAGKALRQNGGTTFKIDVTFDNCEIENMNEGISRTDSSTSTALITNSRLSNPLSGSIRDDLKFPQPLTDGSRVSVIGGGPAGAFFAIHLLREAAQAHRNIAVTIIEQKADPGIEGAQWSIQGCNCCAGGISPELHERMKNIGIRIPRDIIREEYSHVWIHGFWKNFPLGLFPGQRMYSVFRGTLPRDRNEASGGLDAFLLNKAVEQGANVIAGEALRIAYTPLNHPLITISPSSGGVFTLESDFAVMAAGINLHPDSVHAKSDLFRSYRKINPRFVPPKARRALIFELKPGRDYLKKHLNKEMYFVESGWGELHLEHSALAPKGDYLTVTLVGQSIDQAALPGDAGKIMSMFLALRHIRMILPQIDLNTTPVACMCSPYMAVGVSQRPFGHRVAVIGDAAGAKLYKDGLYSALISARVLAETIMTRGTDSRSLSEGYGRWVKWLKKDVRYGRLVFSVIRLAFSYPLLSRVVYQAFATEMKFKEMKQWPLGNIFRKIGTGTADYKNIFRELFTAPVIRSLVTGVTKTARNILTEAFFGIRWESYGKYPTVILKEKRDYFKGAIAASLGIELDNAPDMERMYAIKIRATAEEIFEELGKFGDPGSKFLKLRFVDVRKISGTPNQPGAVIRYRLRKLPVAMDIRLVRCVPGRSLLYEPDALFTTRGKLIFDVTPTRDGNHRLAIYTAFNFRKGRGIVSKWLWGLLKLSFPDYAHDVVWNHAVCCIKGEVERRAG